jgi:acetylornithine deacetylase/succinyl-diaminopimelate desuccinylase-like protein
MSDEMLDTFFEYLRFPSISARPDHAPDVRRCAEWLSSLLASWGLDSAVRETGGAPVVLARNAIDPDKKTVLLYGHYDVQPVEPLDLWTTPPFEPAVRNGLIYARGATDNKGQTFSHLVGLKDLLAQGELPVNLIILVEGEEEIGSPNLGAFLRENRDTLACDVALISDTSMIEPGWPALTLGLRGIACFEVHVTGPRVDLHSGMFGGATPNPAQALARVLARLHDADGRITIPGLYDTVLPISELERAAWEKLPWNEAWFAENTGIAATAGERGFSVLERVWARPTAEINGLTSGHQGAGSKTIIPSHASAKLSFRLVPEQDPDAIAALVVAWFEKEFLAEGIAAEVTYDHGGLPFYTPAESPYIQAAALALEEVFGRPPALTREGLSIPVAALLQSELGIPVVLAGLGLPDCQAHSPNETYPVAHLALGARTHVALLNRWAAL